MKSCHCINHNEQLIRPTTLIRKNSLFAKSTARAKANAIWYSIVQTLAELKDLVKQGVEYFNTVEISSKRNNLTAEDFRNEAV